MAVGGDRPFRISVDSLRPSSGFSLGAPDVGSGVREETCPFGVCTGVETTGSMVGDRRGFSPVGPEETGVIGCGGMVVAIVVGSSGPPPLPRDISPAFPGGAED